MKLSVLATGPKTEKSRCRALLSWLGIILLIRLVSLWFNNSELFFDEAQYWFWAQEPAFGYFSKPPVLAWVIAATTGLCGSDGEFCVRLSAPLFHTATSVMVFLTASRLFDRRTAFWAAILFATIPGVSLSSTIMSADAPLLFFWSVALYAYVRLRNDPAWTGAVLLGLALGFGLNSKYAMVYFLGCAILHMLMEQQDRVPAKSGRFGLACVIGLAMLVPNVLWNLENGFATVSHTGDNIGWNGFNPNWTGLMEFLGSQFGVFGPVLFAILLAACFRMWRNSISAEHRLLFVFSVPVLLLILIQALLSKAYANWAAVTYIAASILVAEILVNRLPLHWLRSSLALHGTVFAALAVAVCFAGPGQMVLPDGRQPFSRTQGASEIARNAAEILDAREYKALVTTDRKLSALMHYNLRNRSETILAWRKDTEARDHFELKTAFQDAPQQPVLAISRSPDTAPYEDVFSTVWLLEKRQISAGEIPEIYFFHLEDIKGSN